MSLRLKLFTILFVVVSIYAIIGFAIQQWVILPSYINLEHRESQKNVERCIEAIHREVQYLDIFNMDWAAWDDTYRFIVDHNAEYIESNLEISTFINNKINLIHYYDREGRRVWGKAVNLKDQSEMVIPEFSQSRIAPSYLWLNHRQVTDSVAGLVMTKRGPLLFSSRPIITSANKGPIRGALMMGRFFNDEMVKKIVNQTRVNFKIINIPEQHRNRQIASVLNRINDRTPVYIVELNQKQSYAYAVLRDVAGHAALLLRADLPRDISATGRGTLRYAQLSICCAAIIMLIVLICALQRTIINSLLKLTRHAKMIQETNDLSMRLKLNRRDAIGELAHAFDHMVEELQQIHGNLEQRVAERTEEIKQANQLLHTEISERRQVGKMLLAATKEIDEKNAQLVESNQQLNLSMQRANKLAQRAEAASEAKSLFLNNIGHEFRTPMNSIMGNASLLGETSLNAEQDKYLEAILGSSKKLLSLINDVLDFTIMESGQLELTTLDFNIRGVLDEVTETYALQAHRKQLGIACLIHHEVPIRVSGDPGRLKQILNNLVDNAVKFTQKGDVLIMVGIESESDNQVTLRFAITDTGIGIPSNRMDHLFDLFSQVDSSSTRKYEGTGIGLAISRHLAHHMGGDLGVESTEGQGATFWFTACLEKVPCEEEQCAFMDRDTKGLRVLIVDDVEINRRVLKEQLKLFRCEFDEVENSEAALLRVQQASEDKKPFDVALIDRMIGNQNGEDVGQIIRADPFLQDIALVLLANIGNRGDAGRLKALGFNGYLTKPVKHSELRDCLKKIAQLKSRKPQGNALGIITRHSLSEERKVQSTDNHIHQKGSASYYSRELSVSPTQIIPLLKRFAEALELADPLKVNQQLDTLKKVIDQTTLENLKAQIEGYDYHDAKQIIEAMLGRMEG